ncbi:hypothetical protein RMATCC62417_14725 [Rhizopus microsporus]|nr:hypothetical protein RMATCC62417_14725 [Rhizopus microsporus]
MSHDGPINYNPDTGALSPTTPSHANKSAALWHSLRAYSRSIESTSLITFGEKATKSTPRERCQARLWVQSHENNSAIFDLETTTVSHAKFYAVLSVQYPDTTGAVPVQQSGGNRRREDYIDPNSLSSFQQTPVSVTSSATSTGTEISVAIDQRHLSISSNFPLGLSDQPTATALAESEKITEEDDSDSSNHPDDDVDDNCFVGSKETDSMSMDEEEANELLKDQESSLFELTNAGPEHTDNPTADIQSVLAGLDRISPLNPFLSMPRFNCVNLLSNRCLLLQIICCSKSWLTQMIFWSSFLIHWR